MPAPPGLGSSLLVSLRLDSLGLRLIGFHDIRRRGFSGLRLDCRFGLLGCRLSRRLGLVDGLPLPVGLVAGGKLVLVDEQPVLRDGVGRLGSRIVRVLLPLLLERGGNVDMQPSVIDKDAVPRPRPTRVDDGLAREAELVGHQLEGSRHTVWAFRTGGEQGERGLVIVGDDRCRAGVSRSCGELLVERGRQRTRVRWRLVRRSRPRGILALQ